jgi:hypothetical protein
MGLDRIRQWLRKTDIEGMKLKIPMDTLKESEGGRI